VRADSYERTPSLSRLEVVMLIQCKNFGTQIYADSADKKKNQRLSALISVLISMSVEQYPVQAKRARKSSHRFRTPQLSSEFDDAHRPDARCRCSNACRVARIAGSSCMTRTCRKNVVIGSMSGVSAVKNSSMVLLGPDGFLRDRIGF